MMPKCVFLVSPSARDDPPPLRDAVWQLLLCGQQAGHAQQGRLLVQRGALEIVGGLRNSPSRLPLPGFSRIPPQTDKNGQCADVTLTTHTNTHTYLTPSLVNWGVQQPDQSIYRFAWTASSVSSSEHFASVCGRTRGQQNTPCLNMLLVPVCTCGLHLIVRIYWFICILGGLIVAKWNVVCLF